MRTKLLFVHALSPLHAGTGQAVGAVDLPIARDRATGHPYLPGSSLKGSLRGRSVDLNRNDTVKIFGPETDSASDHAGALAVGDAQLLLLPARSVSGTFAYTTSPWLLARFARDAKEAGVNGIPPAVPSVGSIESCVVASETLLKTGVGNADKVVFEDLDLTPGGANQAQALDAWAGFLGELLFPGDATWKALFTKRLCLVHDDVMSFLSRHATDVVTRVCIDHETGTAKDGGLWSEESLPVETVLASLLVVQGVNGTNAGRVFQAVQSLTQGSLQLGGKATVGRGRCRLVVAGGAA